MKALVLTDYRQLAVCDVPDPEIGPEDVRVQIKACGICGSDVHGYDGCSGRRIPPLIMGHEAAGVVERVGDNVTTFNVGDRVTFDSTVYCGQCHYCRAGRVNLCEQRRVLGVSCGDYRRHGAFAELICVPQHIVYRLPDEMSFEDAAMIEPVSVAVHAVSRTPVRLGNTAVVVGAGIIGLLVVQALRLAGCGTIVAVDLIDERLGLARQLGADSGLNAGSCNIADTVAGITNGYGADHVVEAVGQTTALETAISCAGKGGTVTLVGNLNPKIDLPLQSVVTRELTLLGTCASAGEYPACLEMMARGGIDVAPLISALASLHDAPQWFDRLYNLEAGLLKVLLQP